MRNEPPRAPIYTKTEVHAQIRRRTPKHARRAPRARFPFKNARFGLQNARLSSRTCVSQTVWPRVRISARHHVCYSARHASSPPRTASRLATRRPRSCHARHASPQRSPRVTASPPLQILPRVTASPTPQMVPRVPRTVWPLKTHAWPSARAFYPCILSFSQNRAFLRTFLLPTHALHVPCAPFAPKRAPMHVFVQFCP